MIFASLAAGALTETLQGVRNRFQEGGSFTMLLLVLLGIGAVVLVAYWLTLPGGATRALRGPTGLIPNSTRQTGSYVNTASTN